jgi:hypothetical protein
MGGNFLVGLSGGARVGRDAGHVQELVGQCLVVHGEQPAVRTVDVAAGASSIQAEILHAVVVIARAVVIVGVAAIVLELGRGGGERIAQAIDHGGRVAAGHAQHVGRALGHGREAQLDAGVHRCRGQRRGVAAAATGCQRHAAQHGRAGGAKAGLEQAAAAQPCFDHVGDRRVVAGVEVFAVMALHSLLLGLCHRVHRGSLSGSVLKLNPRD